MTRDELLQLTRAIAPAIRDYVRRELAGKDAEIATLKGDVADLRTKVAALELPRPPARKRKPTARTLAEAIDPPDDRPALETAH